jgi:Ca2+-binding RTX toxin-like protein
MGVSCSYLYGGPDGRVDVLVASISSLGLFMRYAVLPARRCAVLLLALLVALGTAVVGVSSAAFAAAPANDMFANARAVTGQSGSVAGTLVDATLEAGEPYHDDAWAEGDTAHSVWYMWTAPIDGEVELNVNATSVDLYTGSTLATLQNIDQECFGSTRSWSPNCKFALVEAGTTYRIAVAGEAFPFTLTWQVYLKPAHDDFANAAPLSGLSAFIGVGRGGDLATAQAGEPRHWWEHALFGNSVWYRWTAPWDSNVAVEATTMYPDGEGGSTTDVAVYTGTSLTSLSKRASGTDDDQSDGGWMEPVTFNAVAGTTYYIAVDPESYGEERMLGSLTATPTCKSGVGTTANDTIVGTPGNDVLCGYDGDDVLKGMGGNDLLIGGPGVDAASFADATTAVTANLTTGTATGQGTDTLQDIENLIGSPHNDKLDGNAGTNTLNGGLGIDGLWGQAGNDTLLGADGNDTLGGGQGDDKANGGAGSDTAHFGRAAAVTVNLATRSSTGEGTDALTLLENVSGSPGADSLTGNAGVNMLQGAGGNDTILGEGGNDKLFGAGGNDALTGGLGTDYCDGGTHTTGDTATTCETRVAIP